MSNIRRLLALYLGDIGVLVHLLIAGAAIAVAVLNPDRWMLLAFCLGWCSYVIEEHFVHRFIFHAPAPKSQFWFNMLYRLHYGHHDQIHNRHLIFTPLWFSVVLGLVNLAVLSQLVPLPYAVVFVYGGGVSAYLLFEWMHLLSHFNSTNRGAFTMWVSSRHARHHFIDFKNWYTISLGGELVDKLLGASPDQMTKADNVRTCGLAADDPRLVIARASFPQDKSLNELAAAS